MKKKILMEVHECESCHKTETYVTECLSCGKEFCWECAEKSGTKYRHGVWGSGSCDGYYCRECDIKLIESGKDKKHNAYRLIQRLRAETEAWNRDFKVRADAAEKELEELQKNER